ncbi:hypothetical protein HOLleu_21491 [Holothuria leucospilota]|uniref:Ig-like domain-containing protein n=1 Tax=Holothuria leucospilota TaxID=206669 RepID=A0A9Q1H6I2_HOLLE|nr:hypothetical protein HOLleu_21491 [Holothuria leucospilota]
MAFMVSTYLTTLSLRICVIVITGNLYKRTLTEAIGYETVVVRLGSNVTLPCENIQDSTNEGNLWIFNNISLLYAGYLRYAPADLANVNLDANGSLLIQNVERKNEASYVCRSGSKVILNQYVVIIEGML